MTGIFDWQAKLKPLLGLPRLGCIIWRHGFLPMGFHTIQSIWREGLNDLHVRAIGEAVVRVLRHAGPVYIKIGQIMSTRDDLLPDEICAQLARLYDEQPPPVQWRDVRKQLQKNYPTAWPFSSFEETPVGIGSVAQVHRATLINGAEVAVKVLRPGVEEVIHRDIDSAKLIVKIIFESLGGKAKDWEHMVLEIINDLGQGFVYEVQLDEEARNLRLFKKQLEGKSQVFVPEVFPEFSTPEVLVMDFVPGIPLSKLSYNQMLSPELSKKVASTALKEVLKQILEIGVFHPDPHGGNLILMPDDRIAMIDLAQAARFTDENRGKLLAVLRALVMRDSEEVVRAFLDFAEAPAEFDRDRFLQDVQIQVEKEEGLGRFAGNILKIVNRHGITMTSDTVMLVRSLITIEALVKTLDPDFNIAKTAIPTVIMSFVKNHLKSKFLRP